MPGKRGGSGDSSARPQAPAKKKQKLTPQQVLKTKGFLAASAAAKQAKKDALHDHIVERGKIAAETLARQKKVVAPQRNLLEKFGDKASPVLRSGMPFSSKRSPLYNPTVRKFFAGGADAAAYLPAGLFNLITQPSATLEGSARATGAQAKRFAQHPLREFQNDPWNVSMLGLAGLSGASSVVGRGVNATKAARATERLPTTGGKGSEVIKALARSPRGGSRTIYNEAGVPTTALNFDSPLGAPIAAVTDRLLGLDKPGKATLRVPGREAKWRSEEAQNVRARESSLPQLKQSPRKRGAALRAMRTASRLQRFLMLYGRPSGYVAGNIPSQELMSLSQQGVHMLRNRKIAAQLRGSPSGKVYNKLGGRVPRLSKADRESFMGMSGAGRYASVVGEIEPPGSSRVGKAFGKFEQGFGRLDENVGLGLGKILDDPYRSAAFMHELRRQGVKPQQVGEHMKNTRLYAQGIKETKLPKGQFETNSPKLARAHRITTIASRRANRAIIDYGRLGKQERDWIRDFLVFYPWVKGSAQYTGRFPFEHPYQALAATSLADYGKEHTGLPQRQPSILQGAFKTGERNVPGLGKVPLIENARYAGIFTQPVDTIRSMAALAPGLTGIEPSRYTDPVDPAQPWLASVARAAGPEGFDTGRFKEELVRTIPPVTFIKGLINPAENEPRNRLHPRSRGDYWRQFLGGSLATKPLNPVASQSIYRQERKLGKSKEEQFQLSKAWLREDVLKKVRLDNPKQKTNDRFVIEAASQDERHKLKRLAVLRAHPEARHETRKGQLSKKGEFIAAVLTLIPDTKDGLKEQERFVKEILPIPDIAFSTPSARAHNSLQMPKLELTSELRKMIRTLNQLNEHRPYAEGGARIPVPR